MGIHIIMGKQLILIFNDSKCVYLEVTIEPLKYEREMCNLSMYNQAYNDVKKIC